MRKTALILVVAATALVLTACKTSHKNIKTAPAVVTGQATASTSQTPAATSTTPALPPPAPATSALTKPTLTGSATPTALDPCQLVTSAEASSIAGTTYGSGKEEVNAGGGRDCVYGANTASVLTVTVAQAADAATAQAEWTQAQADAQATIASKLPPGTSANLDTSNAAGLGDKAATVTGATTIAGQPVGFTGIYVLKGSTFFDFGDLVLGKAPPSVATVVAQAQTVLSRLG